MPPEANGIIPTKSLLFGHKVGEHFVVHSDTMTELTSNLLKAAQSGTNTILLSGKTGTGKESIAHFIHKNSPRANGPFVTVDCAALTRSLTESELFGHERGSFTGADRRKVGQLEVADHGTLLIDEVSELSLSQQARLLRFLQLRVTKRVGGTEDISLDVRVIATTNKDLKRMVRNNRFKEDLYYRLNVIAFKVPSLEERPGEVTVLTRYFLERFGIEGISKMALQKLLEHRWTGNIRELEHTIERACVFSRDGNVLTDVSVDLFDMGEGGFVESNPESSLSLNSVVREHLRRVLLVFNGNIRQSAKVLGLSRSTLYDRMVKLGIEREFHKNETL